MTLSRPGARALALLTVLLAALSGPLARHANAQSGPVDSTLARGRVSVLDDGRYVVSLDTHGAHAGMVTLHFSLNADGTVAQGEFVVVVAYAESLNEDGSVSTEEPVEHEGGTEPHHDRMRLVNKGTVSGAITGGHATLAPAGGLVLSGLQLSVATGSLEFEHATGWGALDADLNQPETQGILRLVL